MKSKRVKKEIAKLKRIAFGPFAHLKTNAKKNADKMTWPEREFCKLLKELNVEFETQKIIKDKIYDFFIPSIKMIVEIHGDYWHGHVEKYTLEELNGTQKKNQRNDLYKRSLALTMGYFIETVWEKDLKSDYNDVKNKFKKLLRDGN